MDAQLLLKLSFREPVKLRGFRLLSTSAPSSASVATENADGNTESAPHTVKLFVNAPNLSFSDADSLTPTETLTLTKADVSGEREIKVKFVKYQGQTHTDSDTRAHASHTLSSTRCCSSDTATDCAASVCCALLTAVR